MTSSTDRSARRRETLEILRHNHGFAAPERWLDYARAHDFRRTEAAVVRSCPECGSDPERQLGTYVYYSNRARLFECGSCGLVWSDLRLSPELVEGHFGRSYKSEEYFAKRQPIFDQMASLVDRHAPPGGSVLDVGGAKGHLMETVRRRRPDVRVTVNDVSPEACAAARRTYGFRTVQGRLAELADSADRYDVVVLCDVLYYEPDLDALWKALERLPAPGGVLLLRVSNKRRLMELGQLARSVAPEILLRRTRWRGRVPWFNPEHIFFFSRSFLTDRLRRLGFEEVTVRPARLLGEGLLQSLLFHVSKAVHRATRGRLVPTPSKVVVASGHRR